MYKLSVLWFFIVLPFALTGQSANKADSLFSSPSSYLLLGGGGNYTSVIDRGVSPHLYTAFGPSALTGFIFSSKRYKHDFLARFDYQELENTYEFSSSSMQGFRGDGYYFVGRNIWENKEKHSLYIGPSLANIWTLKIHQSYSNNSTHNHFFSSIAAAATYQFAFSLWNRAFSLSSHTYVPFVNFAITPLYATTAHKATLGIDEPDFFDFMKSGKIVGPASNFGFSFLSDLQYQMLNGNRLRLAYQWHYRKNDGYNMLQMAEHNLTFSCMMNLSKP